jgi:glycosyltransferase involved in cell wall biosynthesis
LVFGIAQEIVLHEAEVGKESGFAEKHKIVFDPPRTVEYRANVDELTSYFMTLMTDPNLRKNMGHALRTQVVKNFDYRVVARQFVRIISEKLGIN